jgi:hypothetical protein
MCHAIEGQVRHRRPTEPLIFGNAEGSVRLRTFTCCQREIVEKIDSRHCLTTRTLSHVLGLYLL